MKEHKKLVLLVILAFCLGILRFKGLRSIIGQTTTSHIVQLKKGIKYFELPVKEGIKDLELPVKEGMLPVKEGIKDLELPVNTKVFFCSLTDGKNGGAERPNTNLPYSNPNLDAPEFSDETPSKGTYMKLFKRTVIAFDAIVWTYIIVTYLVSRRR